jgi:hypothetical protein
VEYPSGGAGSGGKVEIATAAAADDDDDDDHEDAAAAIDSIDAMAANIIRGFIKRKKM